MRAGAGRTIGPHPDKRRVSVASRRKAERARGRIVDNKIFRYSDWGLFDPQRLDAQLEIDAAGIDFDAAYTWQTEHAGKLYQFLGCKPTPGRDGKARFDLGAASVILTGPARWTGNPLWPEDREDQPPSG
jgi:hypothetical protein